MNAQADMQQHPREAVRFGDQSRRVLEDLKVLGGIALERTGAAAREMREQGAQALGSPSMRHPAAQEWLVGLVRARPLTSVFGALVLGVLLGWVLYRP